MGPLNNPLLTRQNELMYRRSMLDNAPVGSVGAPGGVLPSNAQSGYNPGVSLSTLATMTPAIGDLVGLALDAHMYKTQPETRTWGNYGLSALGALPFVPGAAGIIKDVPVDYLSKMAKKNDKIKKGTASVGINPSMEEVLDLMQEQKDIAKEVWMGARGQQDDVLRFVKQGNDIYVWPAHQGIHENVVPGLNLDPYAPYQKGSFSKSENYFEMDKLDVPFDAPSDEFFERGTFEDFLKRYVKKQSAPVGFNKTTTDMPFYDNMLKNPDYFKKAKGKEFRIVEIDPEDYLERAQKGFSAHGKNSAFSSFKQQDLVDEYAEKMKAGEQFPMTVLDYSDKSFSQEGRHRATAAMKAGIKKIPVMIVEDVKKGDKVTSPSAFEELRSKQLKDPYEVFDPRDGNPIASFASEEQAKKFIEKNPDKFLDYDKRPEELQSYSDFEKEITGIAKSLEKERKSKLKLVPKGDK